MCERVVAARGGDDAGDQRGLVRLELLRAAALPRLGRIRSLGVLGAEVGLGGRLDPVGAVAEVDRVQVVAQDLRPCPTCASCGRRCAASRDLLEQRAVVLGLEPVLDELLGDRRAALHRAAGDDVLVERAADAAQVDALLV